MARATATSNHKAGGLDSHTPTVIQHNPWSSESDHGLMQRIATGNRSAFTEFARRHMPAMLGFARRYVNTSEAEDITQEALTRIWLKASQWQERGVSPRSWLMRIVYNLCMDALRRHKRQPVESEMVEDELPCSSGGPEQHYEQTVQQQQLARAMQELPERQRSAILLTTYHGMSQRETAAILEVSVEALESLLSRGRRYLKQHISRQQGES